MNQGRDFSGHEVLPLSKSATAAGFGAIFLWSTTVAFARSLSEQVGPVSAAAAVYTISGIAALFSRSWGSGRRRISRMPRKYLIGCGALFVFYMLFLYLAIGWATSRQQTLEVGLLNYLWPTLTILLSLALLGQRASWSLLPATILALAGVFLVLTQGAHVSWASFSRNLAANPAAYAMAFAAAVAWALYSNLTRRWARGETESAVPIFLSATALVLILLSCCIDEPRDWNSRCFWEAIFLGVATQMGYSLWDDAMRRGDIALVVVGSYFTPLLSTGVSCLYLAIAPAPMLWIGCVALVLGSLLSWRSLENPR